MNAPADELWSRLDSYAIGPVEAALTFTDRLARENRWTPDFATAVVREYKRFCYLAMTAGHEVTPSDAVDQAWHLHLTYSRDYWERFCPEVLGAPLHHGPTAGGGAERTRYYDQYAATLAAYERAFGIAPPAAIWPGARRRFGIDPLAVRVNPRDVMIVSHKTAILLAMAGTVFVVLVGALLLAGSVR